MSQKNIVIIHHHPCWDGVAAAWAIKEGVQDRERRSEHGKPCIRFVKAQYGDEPPELSDADEVYIVDFSYDRDTLLALNDKVETLVVLDHHETAKKELEGLDFCTFDMEKSGARLAWEYFHEDQRIPPELRLIEDRDLWKWEYERTKPFTTRLMIDDCEVEQVQNLVTGHKRVPYTEAGRTLMEYQEGLVEQVADRAVLYEIAGHDVYCVNSSLFRSEIGHLLAQRHDTYAGIFRRLDDGCVKFSLRSEGDLDVTEIAEQFGGGGHKNAGGFLLSNEEAATLFKTGVIKP